MVPFAYYDRLSPPEQAIYRASDGVASVDLGDSSALRPLADEHTRALGRDDRAAVEAASNRLCRALTDALSVEPVTVEVLAVRPRSESSELHGLYTRPAASPAFIQVWMRTAHHRRVVAPRTFARTLLHEVCHHLDYTWLELPESFHTDGFFQRESSLVLQLLGPARARPASPTA